MRAPTQRLRPMSRSAGSSLNETLILALTQCQEQVKVIQQHSSRIEQLQRENERLARELQEYRNAAAKSAQDDTNQTQGLFQKYAEAQAEIQTLKSKVRSYKAKSSKRLHLSQSSPVSTPVTPVPSSAGRSSAAGRNVEAAMPAASTYHEGKRNQEQEVYGQSSDATSSSPPRKRARLDDLETMKTLREVATNLVQAKPSSIGSSGNDSIKRKMAAISHLAEDGEDNAPGENDEDTDLLLIDQSNPIYRRLDGLLAGCIPSKNRLARPASRSPRTDKLLSMPGDQTIPGISNIRHVTSDNRGSPNGQSDARGATSELKDAKSPAQTGAPRVFSSYDYTLPPAKRSTNISNLIKPLRAQSVTELRLSSFKPNPRWLSSHNISFDDFLNDRQYERMRTLATTLPHLPGESHDHHFTDDELLMDFLGPGSDVKIANLTPVARQNLVIEARTKRVANEFRLLKQTTTFEDHNDDPPGFWSTDMPGTQEAEENKVASRQKEQEEVRRRYDDAMSGQGRWIFADE